MLIFLGNSGKIILFCLNAASTAQLIPLAASQALGSGRYSQREYLSFTKATGSLKSAFAVHILLHRFKYIENNISLYI